MITQLEALKILESERENQKLWDSEGAQSVGEEILLLGYYVDQARAKWKAEGQPELNALKEIVKIGAIALRALENHSAKEGTEALGKLDAAE
jgi:hypothetical protein